MMSKDSFRSMYPDMWALAEFGQEFLENNDCIVKATRNIDDEIECYIELLMESHCSWKDIKCGLMIIDEGYPWCFYTGDEFTGMNSNDYEMALEITYEEAVREKVPQVMNFHESEDTAADPVEGLDEFLGG